MEQREPKEADTLSEKYILKLEYMNCMLTCGV